MQSLFHLAAERTQLFVSPENQSHAILPNNSATPIYSEDFFTFIHSLAESKQIDIPNATALNFTLRRLDAVARASQKVQPVPLRTFQPDPETLLLDLHDNFDAVELTRKSWKVTSNLDVSFARPSANLPLPLPEPGQHGLTTYLRQMFRITEEPAQQIAHWLTLALLPGATPPILVITGEARNQAAAKIRKIIDPVPQPLFPFPHNAAQMGQLALTNRVLAFALYGNLTQCKRRALNELRSGMTVKLKEVNKRHASVFAHVARPIIVAAETKIEISRHQITIEINHAGQGDHPQILGALLTLLAATLHRVHQLALEAAPQVFPQTSPVTTTQSDVPGP